MDQERLQNKCGHRCGGCEKCTPCVLCAPDDPYCSHGLNGVQVPPPPEPPLPPPSPARSRSLHVRHDDEVRKRSRREANLDRSDALVGDGSRSPQHRGPRLTSLPRHIPDVSGSESIHGESQSRLIRHGRSSRSTQSSSGVSGSADNAAEARGGGSGSKQRNFPRFHVQDLIKGLCLKGSHYKLTSFYQKFGEYTPRTQREALRLTGDLFLQTCRLVMPDDGDTLGYAYIKRWKPSSSMNPNFSSVRDDQFESLLQLSQSPDPAVSLFSLAQLCANYPRNQINDRLQPLGRTMSQQMFCKNRRAWKEMIDGASLEDAFKPMKPKGKVSVPAGPPPSQMQHISSGDLSSLHRTSLREIPSISSLQMTKPPSDAYGVE